jgi:hypothetical protein
MAAAAMLLITSCVLADQARIAWTACAGEGGLSSESFACNTNSGFHTLVGSFILTEPFQSDSSWYYAADIYFGTQDYFGSTLPDWWRFSTDGCRPNAATVSTDFGFSPQTICHDPVYTIHGSGFSIRTAPDQPPHGGYTYGNLRVEALSPEPVLLEAGQEYLAFRVTVPHTGTVGSGACAGCCERMVVRIQDFWLHGYPYGNDRSFPQSNPQIEWQGSGSGCGPTVARSKTWGQIRALYR